MDVVNEANTLQAKNYGDTFLYHKGGYGKSIFEFVMSAHRVDKDDPTFEDISYEVKKQQVTSTLSAVLRSKNVILLIGEKPLPRSFKVFVEKDPKDPKKGLKVFIDVSEIIKYKDNTYSMLRKHGTILVSYLMSAMNSLIYHVEPNRVIGNSTIIKYSTNCFAKLFTYVVDYLRIGGVDKVRETTLFLSAIYYQCNHLGYDKDSDSVIAKAKNISGLTDIEIAKINFLIDDKRDTIFTNINNFVEGLSLALKTDGLTIDTIVNKWMFLFGSGTQFGLELYEAFATILINVYCGSYLNNQNTIEKIVGPDMTEFAKGIMKIGSDAL